MPIVRMQVTFPVGSDPRDAQVNVWHANCADPETGAPNFQGALNDFYVAIDGLLAGNIISDVPEFTAYRLDDPEPRAPIYTAPGVGLSYGSGVLPPEITMCLSFQGVRTSGVPQARRRGRVYLPTMTAAVIAGDGYHFDTADVTTVANAAAALKADSDGDSTYTWVIWSPTDSDFVEVDNGWVDNAIDIQRRRGHPATVRQVWS